MKNKKTSCFAPAAAFLVFTGAVLGLVVFLFVFFSSGRLYSLDTGNDKSGNKIINDSRNHKFKKFSSAKKAVFQMATDKKTFYCGCPFDENKNVDLETCGYRYRKSKKRASHVVPAEKLCGQTAEWVKGSNACVDSHGKRYKGRRCASEHNASCIMAYNDLHNLRPAIGEINNDRSDYSFADINTDDHTYGSCSFKIKNNKADPPKEVHGDIARIYLHMNKAYPELHILNAAEENFFIKWSESDPVTPEECRQNKKIYILQGNFNQVVLGDCRLQGYSN